MARTENTLLITGASGGIGRACAIRAAHRGLSLLLTDIDEDKLRTLAAACNHIGVQADFSVLDICDSGAVSAFVQGLSIGACIHAAGVSPAMASWDRVLTVNLIAAVDFIAAIKSTIPAGGCVVTIASMSAYLVTADPVIDTLLNSDDLSSSVARVADLEAAPLGDAGVAYAYAKRALIHYVKREAKSWGDEGKRLVSLSPGLIDTEMGRLEASSKADQYAMMRARIPLRRDGASEEIADVALFLASSEAAYITGCDLLVDGGFIGSMTAND